MPTEYDYDVFISHASEDKAAVAQPLADALDRAGLRVWYDEFTLRLGDSLRESIDQGLAKSLLGVVILSPSFFEKRWPVRELNGLTALEMADGRPRIVPIWHGVTHREVAEFSPPLADLLAADTSTDSLQQVTRRLVARVAEGAPEPVAPIYDHYHRGELVDVVALARQSSDGAITGHLFQDCTLLGPAILGIEQRIELVGLTFNHAQIWPLQMGRPYAGAIPIRDCRIEDSELQRIGLAGPAEFMQRMYYLPEKPLDP